MSLQSDVEFISVHAMEMYAKKNHLTGKEIIEVFHKYQVFEHIMLQHEYLPQIAFEEVIEFVKENRSNGGLQHDYDVVIGPVVDDNTMETVQLYIANILTADEAVERLRYNKVNNQVSFHTETALKQLQFTRREQYE